MGEVLRLRAGGSTVDSLEQLLSLLAVLHVEDLPAHAVGGFLDAYLAKLHKHRDKLAAIRRARVLDPDDEKRFLALTVAIAFRGCRHDRNTQAWGILIDSCDVRVRIAVRLETRVLAPDAALPDEVRCPRRNADPGDPALGACFHLRERRDGDRGHVGRTGLAVELS